MTSDLVEEQSESVLQQVPCNILWITGLPDDDDDGELEMRLARVGELSKLEREGERAIATFKNTRAAVDAKNRLDGFTLASGRSIGIRFADQGNSIVGELDAITGEVIRSNRELHWKIGQLVRSTYSAMRQTNGNYPPPKQTLVPDDFKYLGSVGESLDLESKWDPSMPIEDMVKDYDEFIERRPFHNRYVVVYLASGSEESVQELSNFVKALTGVSNIQEVTPLNDNRIVHFSTRSTRDASIIFSTLNGSLKTGEGGLIGRVDIESVKYGPPINTAHSGGKLWFGSSAFQAVDEEKLRYMLSLFGEVDQVRLIKNKNCLFATFKCDADAIRCRNKLFGYEIAPGHFLNVDFAPPMPEGHESNLKRRAESMEGPEQKRHSDGDRAVKLELSKMGEHMCNVLARKLVVQKFTGDDSGHDFYLPKEVDICNRTKVEYCKTHLDKLECSLPLVPGANVPSDVGTVVVWQFAAASERDCQGYDALCDYFVTKERVGFFSSGSVVTYFVPPVPAFLEPLGLPLETRYLTAIQMPAAGQVIAPAHKDN
jgi:hypothetical protein